MNEILSAIRGVTGMMSEITAASVEQSAGIEQVNQAVSRMDDTTQQNAALVEQAAAAAESLEEQAQNLVVTVNGFKLDDKPVSLSVLYAVEDTVKALTKFQQAQQHKPVIRSNNSLRDFSNIGGIKAKPQLLSVGNGDWEAF
jgi:Methyl-accepting chemotaxis protein